MHGNMYHRIHPLLTKIGDTNPKYAQLYMYDNATDFRLGVMPNLNRGIMEGLTAMLHRHNRHVRNILTIRPTETAPLHLGILEPGKYHLNTKVGFLPIFIHKFVWVADENVDARRYNVPSSDEVAAIIPGDEGEDLEVRQIDFRLRGGGLQYINSCHSAYHPLQYVLLFPHGEPGWHPDIPLQRPPGTFLTLSTTRK